LGSSDGAYVSGDAAIGARCPVVRCHALRLPLTRAYDPSEWVSPPPRRPLRCFGATRSTRSSRSSRRPAEGTTTSSGEALHGPAAGLVAQSRHLESRRPARGLPTGAPGTCRVIVPRAGIHKTPHTWLEPDLMLLSSERVARTERYLDGADLVIEVSGARSAV